MLGSKRHNRNFATSTWGYEKPIEEGERCLYLRPIPALERPVAITAKWSLEIESTFFIRLVRMGRATIQQVERDIRMSETQRRYLFAISNRREQQVVQEIFEKREETWNIVKEALSAEVVQ